jgi:hypothetical protein
VISVGELMSDPDFFEAVAVLRRSRTMSAGIASYPEMPDTILGSVQPADGETLETLPEGTKLADVIYVYTASDLRTVVADGYGDIVVDGGRRYQVNQVDEAFRRFGYNRAVCVAEALSADA